VCPLGEHLHLKLLEEGNLMIRKKKNVRLSNRQFSFFAIGGDTAFSLQSLLGGNLQGDAA